jgi:AraC-like DNA-binding protein
MTTFHSKAQQAFHGRSPFHLIYDISRQEILLNLMYNHLRVSTELANLTDHLSEVRIKMELTDNIEAVQRMQDYIEGHLNEPVSLHQLAQAAGYSPYYASRLFKSLVGKLPFDYLRQRRITEAAKVLRDGQVRIIDVALDFVFDSQEGFTRAFAKELGITPKAYALRKPPVQYFLPYDIKPYYLMLHKRLFREGGIQPMENQKPQTVFVQILEKPPRKAILRRGIKATHYFEYCEEVSCDVWGILVSINDALSEPAGMWLPPNMTPPGTSTYVQGVEVPAAYSGPVPEGFDLVDFPACKMMVFQGEPYDDADFETAIEALWEVINRYDPKLYGFDWAPEDGPRMQLEPQGYRGYIEMKPVRSLL